MKKFLLIVVAINFSLFLTTVSAKTYYAVETNGKCYSFPSRVSVPKAAKIVPSCDLIQKSETTKSNKSRFVKQINWDKIRQTLSDKKTDDENSRESNPIKKFGSGIWNRNRKNLTPRSKRERRSLRTHSAGLRSLSSAPQAKDTDQESTNTENKKPRKKISVSSGTLRTGYLRTTQKLSARNASRFRSDSGGGRYSASRLRTNRKTKKEKNYGVRLKKTFVGERRTGNVDKELLNN